MGNRIRKIMWGEFIPGGDNFVFHTNAEYMMMVDLEERMPEEPIAETCVEIDDISDRRAVMAYDEIIAEFSAEKDARLRKYMRTHELRNDGHPVRKDKRKSYRKERNEECDPWRGWDTWKKYCQNELEKADARDWELESVEIAEEAEAEAIRNAIIAEYERIEAERKQRIADMALNEWLKTA